MDDVNSNNQRKQKLASVTEATNGYSQKPNALTWCRGFSQSRQLVATHFFYWGTPAERGRRWPWHTPTPREQHTEAKHTSAPVKYHCRVHMVNPALNPTYVTFMMMGFVDTVPERR